MPTVNFENYQYFIRHWMDWLHFRKSYVEHNQDQNLKYFYLYKGFCKRRWKSFAMFFYSTTEMSGSIFLPTFPVFIVTTNVSLNSCKITQEWRTFIWDFNTPLLIFHTKKRRMRSTTLVLFCFPLTTVLIERWSYDQSDDWLYCLFESEASYLHLRKGVYDRSWIHLGYNHLCTLELIFSWTKYENRNWEDKPQIKTKRRGIHSPLRCTKCGKKEHQICL